MISYRDSFRNFRRLFAAAAPVIFEDESLIKLVLKAYFFGDHEFAVFYDTTSPENPWLVRFRADPSQTYSLTATLLQAVFSNTLHADELEVSDSFVDFYFEDGELGTYVFDQTYYYALRIAKKACEQYVEELSVEVPEIEY